ncbi:hypothetical protein K3U93_10685 [Mycobacterium malmoense]|uniref:hypothetical protein n=1 Tax=Mycobacterium malmoense TaxID=1780 RepID=UPI001593F175|nr:hypothetical protein [Mycobacterium malmoense]QZA19529.1 hypothetical protein K3U93_10685 [Mycobacterium malmoense]UNB96283.1 hypothetical protein H5T25_10675 [Mycobacterium malmoense]
MTFPTTHPESPGAAAGTLSSICFSIVAHRMAAEPTPQAVPGANTSSHAVIEVADAAAD